MASTMTMYSGDFNGDFNSRYLRAPLPLNLPSRKSEQEDQVETPPRVWTFLSVRRRSSSPTPPSTPPSTPPPSPTKSSPPPVPIKPRKNSSTTLPPSPPKPSVKTATKTCSACHLSHEKSGFSKKQWGAGKGRRCISCTPAQSTPMTVSKPEPPKPVATTPVEEKETVWDVKIANRDSQYEEEVALQRLVDARKSRSKPVRAPAPQPTAPQLTQPIVPRIRHKICQTAKKGFRCKVGDSCDGAHSIAEYAPPPCSWGAKCRHVKETTDGFINVSQRPCNFIHPGESQDHYHTRSGRHAPRFWTR